LAYGADATDAIASYLKGRGYECTTPGPGQILLHRLGRVPSVSIEWRNERWVAAPAYLGRSYVFGTQGELRTVLRTIAEDFEAVLAVDRSWHEYLASPDPEILKRVHAALGAVHRRFHGGAANDNPSS